MGVIFFGLLPLPGLLGVTAFLGGLVIVLVLHARHDRPWRSLLVRAGVGLVAMWIAVTVASLTLVDRFGDRAPLEGAPGAAGNARTLLAMIVLASVLLLMVAGALLGWIACASRPHGQGTRA